MKVSKINTFFRKIGEGQIKHRKLCIAILLIWTLICLSGMRNFRSESTNSDWIVNGSEIQQNSDHFKEMFGNDQYVLVLVQVEDVFAPDLLKMEVNMDYLKFMGNKVPFVQRIEKILQTKIGNLYSYDVMIEFDEEAAFKDPLNMLALEDLEKDLGKLQMTKITNGKPRVRSITRMVKEMNRVFNSDDMAYFYDSKPRTGSFDWCSYGLQSHASR